MTTLAGKRGNVTSQHGEDGLIAAIFAKIGMFNRWCFEVGAGDGVTLSNTWALREDRWRAVLIEADKAQFGELVEHRNAFTEIRCRKIEATGENSLDYLLAKCGGFPITPDFGVIDIDGDDLYIWAMLQDIRPRVLMIEFNPNGDGTLTFNGQWQAGRDSILALGEEKGYTPIVEIGCNLIFIDKGVSQ